MLWPEVQRRDGAYVTDSWGQETEVHLYSSLDELKIALWPCRCPGLHTGASPDTFSTSRLDNFMAQDLRDLDKILKQVAGNNAKQSTAFDRNASAHKPISLLMKCCTELTKSYLGGRTSWFQMLHG